MAKKFKDYYDGSCAQILGDKLSGVTAFETDAFVQYVEQHIAGKEFHDRQEVFCDAFDKYLPQSYETNLATFKKILGPKLQKSEGMFTEGWWLWPVGHWVKRHAAAENFAVSVDFIYELTQRFTGEFAVRPLLAAEPEKTLHVCIKWSTDSSVHVRRLASEGMRIRLPWAQKVEVQLEHFALFSEALSNLRADPEKFVQKSVANNLNDLTKKHVDLARQIVDSWLQDGELADETRWILKHGTRYIRKRESRSDGQQELLEIVQQAV